MRQMHSITEGGVVKCDKCTQLQMESQSMVGWNTLVRMSSSSWTSFSSSSCVGTCTQSLSSRAFTRWLSCLVSWLIENRRLGELSWGSWGSCKLCMDSDSWKSMGSVHSFMHLLASIFTISRHLRTSVKFAVLHFCLVYRSPCHLNRPKMSGVMSKPVGDYKMVRWVTLLQ